MKKTVKKIIEKSEKIRVKLDHRTVITLKTREALKYWLEQYPNAQILY